MKRIRVAIIAVTFAVMAAGRVDARLYETKGQCETRYGAAVKSIDKGQGVEVCLFSADPYSLMITYEYGQAQQVVYEHKTNSRLSDEDVKTLLDANNFGTTWKPGVLANYWERSDGRAFAFVLGDKLYVTTEAWHKRAQREKEEKARSQLRKF